MRVPFLAGIFTGLVVVAVILWSTGYFVVVNAQGGTAAGSCVLDGVTYAAGSVKYERYSSAPGLQIAQRQAAFWKGGWWVEKERERWRAPETAAGNDGAYVHLSAWCGF